MSIRNLKKMAVIGIIFGIFCFIFTSHVSAAELVSTYDFNGNLSDSLGSATLTTLSTNTTSDFKTDAGIGGDTTYWEWTSTDERGGGFYIDIPKSLISSDNYSIGLRFAYNEVSTSYEKIIDYRNRESDNGFYFLNHILMFYPSVSGSTGTKTYTAGDILDLVITRNSSTNVFTAYFVIDGTLTKEVQFTDTNAYASAITVGDNIRFGFFHDDLSTPHESTTGGKVYSIKFWDGAVEESSVSNAMNLKYLVSFNDNVIDETITMSATQEIEVNGKAVEPTAPLRAGYTFNGWYTTSTLETKWDFNNNTVTANTTLYAKWTINSTENQTTSSSSSPSSTSSPSAPVCSNSKPYQIPDLFQIDTTSTTAKLFFTPMADTNNFYISYSEQSNAEEHGAQVSLGNEGVQSYTVNLLKPNMTYYFKVRGQNGCMPGDWSNTLQVKSGSKKSFYRSFSTN